MFINWQIWFTLPEDQIAKFICAALVRIQKYPVLESQIWIKHESLSLLTKF